MGNWTSEIDAKDNGGTTVIFFSGGGICQQNNYTIVTFNKIKHNILMTEKNYGCFSWVSGKWGLLCCLLLNLFRNFHNEII